eukprot:TRINITY_DN634_c0_g1_i2.p1 TRINITY_DN634_c0_g1~~TRINITY_DN634_c0_g1_i2.p1  ORF type:complete len:847 (+),score=149.94 TRINITY_DN634_c0_g1_i2:53-2593(+)
MTASFPRMSPVVLVTLFIACNAASEELTHSLPADDECTSPHSSQSCALAALQRRGILTHSAANDSDANGSDLLEQVVQAPLRDVAIEIRDEVTNMIFSTAKQLKLEVKDSFEIYASSVAIRNLAADVVAKVLMIRDNSSAVDTDPRPKSTSRATLAQDRLEAMQKYMASAWPIVLDQIDSAFGDKPALATGVEDGIHGSLTFLEPALKQAWGTEKFLMPVVKELVSDVGNSSAAMLEKASCSSSFAESLGDLTSIYAKLAEAKNHCSAQSASSATAVSCAQDLVGALAHGAGGTAQGSKAMWECFGIDWECSRIINSALAHMFVALSTSLEISAGCKTGKASCSLRKTFAAYGDLWGAASALDFAADLKSCGVKGSHELYELNPQAATPADLKEPSLLETGEQKKGIESFSELPLLEVVSSVTDSQPSAEVAKSFSEVAASIETLLQSAWIEAVGAVQTHSTSGFVKLADDVLDVLRADVPKFLEAVKKTSAVSKEDLKDGPALKQREVAQQDIIKMMKFTIELAPKVVKRAHTGAGMTNADFARVDARVEEARVFFGKALEDAWEGLSLQLPRVENLSESVDWAPCAAGYAESLAKLTNLYSGFASTAADCKLNNEGAVDSEVCESDMLTDFTSIQQFVTMSSNMMQTCFQSSWKCLQATSRASKAMLSTMTEAISVRANCKNSGNGSMMSDNCKSLALSAVGSLVAAADALDASKLECMSPTLPEQRDDESSAAASVPGQEDLNESLGSSAGSGSYKCNVQCTYSNYLNSACHGSTCVCSGGGKRTTYFPGSCHGSSRAPRGESGRGGACNVICTYSNYLVGRCHGRMCTCSGGKGHMTIPGHC